MSDCTWLGCTKTATHCETGRRGETWAHLCDEHHARMDCAIDSVKAELVPAAGVEVADSSAIKRLVGTWIKAQGGAEAAADRMMK